MSLRLPLRHLPNRAIGLEPMTFRAARPTLSQLSYVRTFCLSSVSKKCNKFDLLIVFLIVYTAFVIRLSPHSNFPKAFLELIDAICFNISKQSQKFHHPNKEPIAERGVNSDNVNYQTDVRPSLYLLARYVSDNSKCG